VLEEGTQNIASPAYPHLLTPVFVDRAFTNGSIDKPAKRTGLKLPGGTPAFSFGWALFDDPAGCQFFFASPLSGEQKIELPLRMRRHGSPTLLVAVNRFERRPQQSGHLKLRLAQCFPKTEEFVAFHDNKGLSALFS